MVRVSLHTSWLRLSLAGLLLLGCSDILGIHDPFPRVSEAQGGDAGAHDRPLQSGAGGGGMTGDSGAGGEPMSSGGAGAAGDDPGSDAGVGGVTGIAGAGGGPAGVSGAGAGGASGNAGSGGLGGNGGNGGAGNGGAGNGGAGNGGTGGAPECGAGDVSCKDNYPRSCVNGAWLKAASSCTDMCIKGACLNAPSCAPLVNGCNQESCCLSYEVTGNNFNRDGNANYPATVSSFTMDKYEVTVSRMRSYLAWYFGPEGSAPTVATGKSAHFSADPGWKDVYPLPARSAQGMQDMNDMLGCATAPGGPADVNATYFGQHLARPINCVNFYVAYAFCIWDGGRLPTEAEYNFASTTSEQRTYPWSVPPQSVIIDTTYAVYQATQPADVGSKPAGAGAFGQLDLTGNVSQWNVDYYQSPVSYVAPCVDCLNTTATTERSARGASYLVQSNAGLKTDIRKGFESDVSSTQLGFRCVHDL